MARSFMPLYTSAYLGDTKHLTPLKHGIYLLMLMHCWEERGPLPLDEQEIAGITNCRSADEIEAMRYVLNRFFVRMEDGWYNERMTLELTRRRRISESRKAAGAAGGTRRHELLQRAKASKPNECELSQSTNPQNFDSNEIKDLQQLPSNCLANAKQMLSKCLANARNANEINDIADTVSPSFLAHGHFAQDPCPSSLSPLPLPFLSPHTPLSIPTPSTPIPSPELVMGEHLTQRTNTAPTLQRTKGDTQSVEEGNSEGGQASTDLLGDPIKDEPKAYRVPDCPYTEIVAAYNRLLPSLPRCEVITDTRRRHMQARWRQVCLDDKLGKKEGLEWFEGFFIHVSKSKFLTGRAGGSGNRKPFVANFDWLMKESNFVKVYEGLYD